MAELTPTQANMLTFIRNFSAGSGYPPTRAEISRNFGWASNNAAQDHLNALVKKGAIRVAKGLARGITVVGGAA